MSGHEFWNRLSYWMPPSVERELAALTTADERCAARKTVWLAMMKRWRTRGMLAGGIVLYFALFALLIMVARRNRTWSGWVVEQPLPAAVALALVIGFGMCWMLRRGLRRELREVLIARGVPVCRGCGYSLTGNTSDRCPECGIEVGGPANAD